MDTSAVRPTSSRGSGESNWLKTLSTRHTGFWSWCVRGRWGVARWGRRAPSQNSRVRLQQRPPRTKNRHTDTECDCCTTKLLLFLLYFFLFFFPFLFFPFFPFLLVLFFCSVCASCLLFSLRCLHSVRVPYYSRVSDLVHVSDLFRTSHSACLKKKSFFSFSFVFSF